MRALPIIWKRTRSVKGKVTYLFSGRNRYNAVQLITREPWLESLLPPTLRENQGIPVSDPRQVTPASCGLFGPLQSSSHGGTAAFDDHRHRDFSAVADVLYGCVRI